MKLSTATPEQVYTLARRADTIVEQMLPALSYGRMAVLYPEAYNSLIPVVLARLLEEE